MSSRLSPANSGINYPSCTLQHRTKGLLRTMEAVSVSVPHLGPRMKGKSFDRLNEENGISPTAAMVAIEYFKIVSMVPGGFFSSKMLL
jgi:hypothetical protein